MMIDPPIEKLIKMAPCRYALVVAVTKLTKEILAVESGELEESGMKAVSYAAKQIYDGKVKIIV